jgi:hypothetical protein
MYEPTSEKGETEFQTVDMFKPGAEIIGKPVITVDECLL